MKVQNEARNYKKERGITLIALIITIIILVILAAVTINAAYNSGIIDYAVNGTQNYIEGAKQEELELKYIEAYIKPSWKGEIAEEFEGGTGTQSDPYKIKNGEQLAYFAKEVNEGNTFEGKYVVLESSINLGNREFIPIGKGTTGTRESTDWINTENYFDGTFDGQGNVITGLKITQEEMHGVGLIGVLGENGTIKDVMVNNGTIIGRAAVGGVVGASKGTISNCRNSVTIIAQDNTDVSKSGQQAGGIVGFVKKGSITNCINDGNVTTKDECMKTGRGKYSGGIVGHIVLEEAMTINNCTNNGNILSQYQQVGGIVGSTEYSGNYVITINNCKNTGAVTAKAKREDLTGTGLEGKAIMDAGGMIGYGSVEINITGCANGGNICATSYACGGIVGGSSIEINITGCINSGTIVAKKQQAGGIIGKIEDDGVGNIRDCQNSGSVSAETIMSGGIVGWVKGSASVRFCFNSGVITASDQLPGGIIGRFDAGSVENCYNIGEINANSAAQRGISGGISGVQTGGTITNVYNSGTVTVENYNDNTIDAVGGIVGLQTAGTVSNAYNKGTLVGGDSRGGIVGQQSGTPTVEDVYYNKGTDTALLGIGGVSPDPAKVFPITVNINTLDEFLQKLNNNQL